VPTHDTEETEAQKLYAMLREFEQAQDSVMALGGRIVAGLVAAQHESELAPSVGQPVFTAFIQAVSQLAAARGSTVEGHRSLEKLARAFRIPFRTNENYGYGDMYKYPPTSAAIREDQAAA
jgi:hypothetical protein